MSVVAEGQRSQLVASRIVRWKTQTQQSVVSEDQSL